MRRFVIGLIGLTAVGLGAAWVVTRPHPRDMGAYAGLTGDKAGAGRPLCHWRP